MTQSNNGLATLPLEKQVDIPKNDNKARDRDKDSSKDEPDAEDLIEEEEISEEVIGEEDDENKAAKGAKSRRRTQTKKNTLQKIRFVSICKKLVGFVYYAQMKKLNSLVKLPTYSN